MNQFVARMNLRIIALLLLLESISVYLLWTINPLGHASEAVFSLFLAVDLVSFSMISYIYRVDKRGDRINRGLLLAGCCMAILLILTVFFV